MFKNTLTSLVVLAALVVGALALAPQSAFGGIGPQEPVKPCPVVNPAC